MSLLTKTRGQLRQEIALNVLSPDKFIIGTYTASDSYAAGTPSITLSDTAGLYEDNHWKGGWVCLRGGVSTYEARRITQSVAATGVLTLQKAFTTGPSTSDAIEVYAAPIDPAQFHQTINDAIADGQDHWPIDAVDTSILLEHGRELYDTPSGWMSILEIRADLNRVSGDEYYGTNQQTVSEKVLTSGTKLGQGIQTADQMTVGAVWLKLRKIGSPTTTLTLRIETDSSALPSGTLVETYASTTVSASTVPTQYTWVKFAFSNPPVLYYNTQYHLVLSQSGGTYGATDYVTWVWDSSGGYMWGSQEAYSGSWAAGTGALFFFVTSAKPEWGKMRFQAWKPLHTSTRQIQIKEPVTGLVPIMLVGQSVQAQLSADSDSCLMNPAWLLPYATATWLVQRFGQSEIAGQQARLFADKAAAALQMKKALPRGRRLESS